MDTNDLDKMKLSSLNSEDMLTINGGYWKEIVWAWKAAEAINEFIDGIAAGWNAADKELSK